MRRLSNVDSSKLDNPSKYYNDGFALLSVKNNSRVISVLNELLVAEKPKENYYWDHSMNSHSLRPDVFSYDNCFLDFLFDNDLPQKLEEYSCRRLTLSHIQIVKTDPGRSYQDWHRDTYQFGENPWVGNTPPANKIIFYPVLKDSEPRLKIIKSSHRCAMNDSSIDAQIINNFENYVLHSDNNQILMFDTSLLHAVVPDVNPIGSIRLIYNFITEHQYTTKYSSKNHHKILHDIYEERLKGNPN